MPVSLDPYGAKKQGVYSEDAETANYTYDYPNNLDLKPGSALHSRIKNEVYTRAQESYRKISAKHNSWREIDRTLRAYVDTRTSEKPDNKTNKETEKRRKIVIPMSYATLDTLLTYMTTALLQPPYFKYRGVGPEDVSGAILMQHIIEVHCRRNRVGLALHTQLRDAFAYGIGIVSPVWHKEYGKRMEMQDSGFVSTLTNAFRTLFQEPGESDYQLLYEGNALINIDPYRYLPDPNVSASDIQDAEYAGWIDRTNLMTLLRNEAQQPEVFFNGKYLKHYQNCYTNITTDTNTGREMNARERDNASTLTKPVDIIKMYIDLIPKDWGLGTSEVPEKWFFALAGDNVVVEARPHGLIHGKIPLAVAAPDYDGYSVAPASRLEILSDLQDVVDFLYTSRIENIRKSINDMVVVDPFLVNVHDLDTPEPGKIIRMRRQAWGQGKVNDAIKQLDVRDSTAGHLQDTTYLQGIMQQISGASDSLKGMIQTRGSRVSATEARDSRVSGLSRLEKSARIIGLQSMQSIAHMFASHVQQLMSQSDFIQVTGDLSKMLEEDFGLKAKRDRIKVSPRDIIVNFDIEEMDGSIPGSEDVGTLTELFQIINQNPNTAMQFDLVRMVRHIGRQAGVKNIEDFAVQVMSDEEVLRQEEAGTLTPLQRTLEEVPE